MCCSKMEQSSMVSNAPEGKTIETTSKLSASKRSVEVSSTFAIATNVSKASKILNSSEAAARTVLNKLSQKGYLTVDTSHSPYIYRLQQHMPN